MLIRSRNQYPVKETELRQENTSAKAFYHLDMATQTMMYSAGARSQNRKRMTYVRDIPLLIRQKLCKILDVQGPRNWKELAALLGFTADDCYSFEKAYYIPGGSPADEMLKVWDFGNHTVTELYNKLYQMNHARGMMLLQDLAGHLGINADELHTLERALFIPGGSPTDQMLRLWDIQNHTITELFDKLYEIKHARCMMLLEEFVDAAHREKIKKVQGRQPDDKGEELIASTTLPMNHQPHQRRHDGDGKLYEQPSNIPAGVPNQTHLNQYQKQSNAAQYQPHPAYGNREPEVSAASQSDGSPSPGHNDNSTMDKILSYNLDGGTQKELNSPFVRPGACNINSDGKLSNDSNPADTVRKTPSSREEKERLNKMTVLSSVLTIPYERIRTLTQNFSDSYKLGSGSFGTVYYMFMENTKFAVKRLHVDADPNSSMNASRFSSQMKEITSLVMYKHENIISLTANCTDGPEPCLVYEFMQNGSLEDNLQMRGTHKQPLSWQRRNEIALDSARGLQYLHDIQDTPLIHGDIKSANILLDKNFDPKLADFGLARYGPNKGCSYTVLKTSKAYGTMPYLPHDFLKTFKLSVKVDVYSFGIVLMEILTGEKAADEKREPKTKWLVDIVMEVVEKYKNEDGFEKKIISELCDKRCPDWPWDLAWDMLALALNCCYKFSQKRPAMKEVVEKLKEINNRMDEREALRQRISRPTENTEPLQSGREPEESVYEGGSSTELQQQQHQDPKITSTHQKTTEMTALDRKCREAGITNTLNRPANQDQSFLANQLSQQQLQQQQHQQYHAPSCQQQYAPSYQQQYRPPPHMAQDLRSVSQDSTGYNRQQAGSPQQSFPTGTSSTVPSSFMNRPTPPSTATPPSTNPPVYSDQYYDERSRYPSPHGHYPANDYRQYPPESHDQYGRSDYPPRYPQGMGEYRGSNIPNPYHEQAYRTPPPHHPDQYHQYSQNQYLHHPPGYHPRQYTPRPEYENDRWNYERPPSYSGFNHLASINPDNFTAAPPTPAPPNQGVSRMEDQMRRLDLAQVPQELMHRGPEFPDTSRHTPSPSRHTPSPPRQSDPGTEPTAQEGDVTRTSSTLQQQTSYVQFPDSMHETTDTIVNRVPIQQTDVIPNPATGSSTQIEPISEACPSIQPQVPDISPPQQLQLDGATTSCTTTQELEQPTSTVPSLNGWDGERKRPVPSQHTDKLPTRELQHDNLLEPPAVADNALHSAPPAVGLTDEEFESMRSRNREPTQKTEPIG